MVYQGATGLYHFLINVIPFISNSVVSVILAIMPYNSSCDDPICNVVSP